jgi:hypothetical protein
MKINILFIVTLGLAAGASVRAAPVSRSRAWTRNVRDQLDMRDRALLVVKRGDNVDLPVSSQIGPQTESESSLAHDPNSAAKNPPQSVRAHRTRVYRGNLAVRKQDLQTQSGGDPSDPATQEAIVALAAIQRKKAARNRRYKENKKARKTEDDLDDKGTSSAS